MKRNTMERRSSLREFVGALSLLWVLSREQNANAEEDYSFFEAQTL